MKFAHLGDCHLGGWRQPELRELNFKYFQTAINKIIQEKLDFLLISGDLFDSAYPPIETLKDTFKEFRKLSEAKIPVFIIAGSHDYSASGKTFLDVLEQAGFCKNVALFENRNEKIILQPTIFKNVAIYGYPGKKSGLEVEDIEKITLNDSPGLFKILMLHTAIRGAIGNLHIRAVEESKLPKVNYLALGHLHINFQKEEKVYSGPIFPNNLSELEELQGGSFYIFYDGKIKREFIKLKEISTFCLEIKDAFSATNEILNHLEKENLKDKIVILKLKGILENGKVSDINFFKVEQYAKNKGAYVFLKNTSNLISSEQEILIEFSDTQDLEKRIIEEFEKSHAHKLNPLIFPLFKTLQMEKKEEEKTDVFEDRLISEIKKLLPL